ncbi:prepilin peptidase [Nitrosomonas communis]|uniref:Prepilin leader peptidase/N-methyltransferase n=1 Tax=Nitrosomonas communis TaxID=44574 RepID=A0A1I4IUZ2_9PROT|nr:A24 family peptidase [Nitrosomonas communis]SFL57887.1 leader peptidase (prepilin peptidase) / N-methyltransferase [Nitrosomonas communis]
MTLIESLQHTSAIFIAFTTLIGIMVGSFLNVVIHRLPRMMERAWHQQCAELRGENIHNLPVFNLVIPRSTCPRCEHRITALENIPIISYLFLKGYCSQCNTRISLRYPIIEGLTGIMSGFTAWHFGFGLTAIAALLFIWAMIALTFIDFDSQLLPDAITLPLLWMGLLFNLDNGFIEIRSAIIGTVAGYLVLWTIYWGFKLTTGKEGMGYGDFKLLAAIGAWLGWQMLPLVILFSSFVGGAISIILIITKKFQRNTTIPFGPYLAGGGLIALFWGNKINHAYLGLF